MEYTVTTEESGRKVRDILRRSMGVSYTALKSAKWNSRIFLNGEAVRADAQVNAGDRVRIEWAEGAPVYQLKPFEMPVEVPYEDEYLTVDKDGKKQVKLKAVTNKILDGVTFDGWSGDASGNSEELIVDGDQPLKIHAKFSWRRLTRKYPLVDHKLPNADHKNYYIEEKCYEFHNPRARRGANYIPIDYNRDGYIDFVEFAIKGGMGTDNHRENVRFWLAKGLTRLQYRRDGAVRGSRNKTVENKYIKMRFCPLQFILAAHCPGGRLSSEEAAAQGPGKVALIFKIISYKVRSCHAVRNQKLNKKAGCDLDRCAELFLKNKSVRKLSAHDVGTIFSVPQEHQGIEGFNAVHTLVIPQKLIGRPADTQVKVFHLHLDDERHLSVDRFQDLLECRYGFTAVQKPELSQLGQRIVTDSPLYPAHAMKGKVVKDHRHAVPGHLNIKFNTVSLFHCPADRGQRIFGMSASVSVKTPMRKKARLES